MIEWIVEFFVEIIISPIGGSLRWLIFRKKSLKEYVSDNWETNLLAFFTVVVIIAITAIVLSS